MNRGEVARGGALSFGGAATSAALGLGLTIGLARILGDEGSGVVLQAMSVFAIVLALAKFGLDSTAIWLLPRVRVDDPASVSDALRAMVLLVVTVSVAVTLAFQPFIPMIWGQLPLVVESIRCVMWFLPAGALVLVLGAALRVVGDVRAYVVYGNVALPIFRLAAVLAVAATSSSVAAVALAWAAPTVPVALLLALVVVQRLKPLRETPPTKVSRKYGRDIVRFAIPRTVSAGLEQALQWVDVLIVGLIAGSAAAGVYGGASRFVQAGLMVDAALRVVVAPRLSAALYRADRASVQELYGLASVWLVLFATPFYVVLAFFAPVILGVLGPDFVTGSAALVLLCLGATVTFLAGNVHSVLLMSGRSGWAAFNKAVVLAINIVGNLVLVPVVGIVGAAFAWVLAMVVDAALAAFQVRHFIGIEFRLGPVLLALVVAVGTYGSASGGALLILGATWQAMVLAGATGTAAFMLVCLRLRQRLYLDGLLGALRGRPDTPTSK